MNKNNHGGKRIQAGRKSSYGEKTRPVRIPESQVEHVLVLLEQYRAKQHRSQAHARPVMQGEATVAQVVPLAFETPPLMFPVMSHRIAAGFPSPADDYVEHGIDLNEHLILHREATYILRVSGWSMVGAGIHDGDEIIVDRAIDPHDNHIVVAVLNNQLTVKRFRKSGSVLRLVAENPEFPDIVIGPEEDLMIWGVVTRVLHKV